MKNNLWQKTILELYVDYDSKIRGYDAKIDKLVRRGFDVKLSTLDLVENMRLLILYKKNVQYAKIIVNEVFSKVDVKKSIVYQRYYLGLKFVDIAKKMKLQLRTVFRHFDKEMNTICFIMNSLGYDNDTLEKEFSFDSFFMNAYNRISAKQDKVSYQNPKVNVLITNKNEQTDKNYNTKNSSENSIDFQSVLL